MAQTNKSGTNKSGTIGIKKQKILKILLENPEGLRIATILKASNLKRRSLYRHLSDLRDLKLIENIWPIWRLCQIQGAPLKVAQLIKDFQVQLHEVSYIIKLIDKPSWWEKRDNQLMKLSDFNFEKEIPWGNNKYQVISREDFLIQTFSNSIVIFNRKHYYAHDSYECFIESLKDTLNVFSLLEERLRYKFFKDGIPQFTVRSSHYVKLNDAIAEHCKKIGKMLAVEIDGELRAWVDQSDPFGLETGNKDYGMQDNKEYSDFVADILRNNPPKPSETLNMINGLVKIQSNHERTMVHLDHNIKTHFEVLAGIKSEVRNLGVAVEDLVKLMKELKK